MNSSEVLSRIRESVRNRFEVSRRVLSFDEYFELASQNPYLVLRDAAHYVRDAIEFFGTREVDVRGKKQKRFKAFDLEFHHNPERPECLIGHEAVQARIHQILTGFSRTGRSNRLVVLHGPNGSAKTSFLRCLSQAVEAYAKEDAGAVYCFSWVFPHDSFEKPSMGIGSTREISSTDQSFARLEQEKIGAILRSELHENPLFLLPKEDRTSIFKSWMDNCPEPDRQRLSSLQSHFLEGELSHKNTLILEALLNEAGGDMKKILRHIRVERFYLSKRFRRGLVTVEPQFGVDATVRQVTLDRSVANLPPSLQSLNLFQLEGDLVDGNRGFIEYNDFLKRPVEHFKYLLGTCESGSVNLGHVVAFLDTIFFATTDERHLEAFREHPEYGSFKARLEFVRVPYLLRVSEEERIYREVARTVAGSKELLPHTTHILALWAVMSRLKRPMLKNKSAVLTKILEAMTPLQKADLYDRAQLPDGLSEEERRELKGHVEELAEESQSQPYYEGMLGASARELKGLLQAAAQNEYFSTLGPNAVFSELRKLVKRPMDFEYLRLEPNHGFHAFEDMIEVVRKRWLDLVDEEIRQVLGLQESKQFEDTLNRYITHITAKTRGERIRNRITGKDEAPDSDLMHEFETMMGQTNDAEAFRKNLISRLGAWSVDNKGRDFTKGIPYGEVFPELIEKLENRHHQSQLGVIKSMAESMLDVDVLASNAKLNGLSESAQLALKAYKGMQEKFGYGPRGAKEALVELMKSRYV